MSPLSQAGWTCVLSGLGASPFQDSQPPEGKVLWPEVLWAENYEELSERELWVCIGL